jgi:hypothetical protein
LVSVLAIVYLSTLLPGVGATGDTAKFQFVGWVLGIPHPTGYPTYLIINNAFVHLVPFGTVAWRANLLSAACAIATVIVIAAAIRRLRLPWVVLTCLTLGFTKQLWMSAVVAEVYTLATLFMAVIVLLLVSWQQTRQLRTLQWAVAVWGVSLGHHMLTLVTLPGLAAAILATEPRVLRRWSLWLAALAGVMIGVGQYGILILRGVDQHTPFVETVIDSWGCAFDYMLGGKFRSVMFPFSFSELIGKRLPKFLEYLVCQYAVVVPLAITGLGRLPRGLRAFVVAVVLADAFVVLNYNIPDIEVYILPSVIALALPLAGGYGQVADWLRRRKRQRLLGLLWLLPLSLLIANYGVSNQADNHDGINFCDNVLTTVGEKALLLDPGYVHSCYLWYTLLVGGGQERNVYLATGATTEAVLCYLNENKPLYLRYQRRWAPAGLSVYALDDEMVKRMRDEGCDANRVGDHVWLIGGHLK